MLNDFALDDGAQNQQRSSQSTSTSAPVIYYQQVAERVIDQILKDMDPETKTHHPLPPDDILSLCRQAGEIFLSQPALLELKAPLVVGINQPLRVGLGWTNLTRFVATSRGKWRIYSGYFVPPASHLKQIIYSWATTDRSKSSAYLSLTR